MASTFTINFGLEEIGDGEQSGTWGNTTNFNFDILDRIAAYKAISLSGTTHTLTVREVSPGSGTENLQDGMHRVIKFTGALGGNNTVTIAPNTAATYFIFENATTDSGSSGPYSVIISQGSGDNVTIENGKNAIVYCDGTGSGAAVINALGDLQVDTLTGTLSTAAQPNITSLGTLTTLTVDDIIINGTNIGHTSDTDAIAIGADGDVTLTQDLELQHDGATISFGTNDDVTLTHVHDTGLLLNSTMQLQFSDASQYINAPSATVLDVNATDEIELNATLVDVNATLDVSGAAQFSSTVTVGVDDTGYDVKLFGATAGRYLLWDESANALILYGELQTVTAGTSNLALGVDAGISIASGGNYNVLLGDNAGESLTTGDTNVAVGYGALKTEDAHGRNVAVGYQALEDLNAGAEAENTVVGFAAGKNLTTGKQSVAIGSQALQAETDGNYNVAVGYKSLFSLTGASGHNVAVGYTAADSLTTGSYNVAIGSGALRTEDTGERNIAIGYHAAQGLDYDGNGYNVAISMYAGRYLTTGISNVLVGYGSGGALGSASYNIAIGQSALAAEDTDGGNVAIGHNSFYTQNVGADALSYNVGLGHNTGRLTTTGIRNTFIGGRTGEDNTEGTRNTFVGYAAGLQNIDGSYNTAVGVQALQDNTGADGCVAMGYDSLANVTTGINNTGLGRQAGQLLTTGDLNTAVGAYALDAETVGDRSTAVGNSALSAQANAGNADIYNAALGYAAGQVITTGKFNTCMGANSGGVLTTGSDNTFLGYNTDASAVDVSDEIVIGRDVVGGGTATARFGLGSNTATLGIDGSDTSWAAASDERLKTEIKDSNAGLDFVNDLRPVTYQWKAQKDVPSEMSQHDPASDEPCKGTGKTHHGFVAQDVKRVIDNHELANGHNIWSEDPDGTQQIAPGNFMPMAIRAIQELSAKVEILEARLQQYESR